jgi:hypothetical protein
MDYSTRQERQQLLAPDRSSGVANRKAAYSEYRRKSALDSLLIH